MSSAVPLRLIPCFPTSPLAEDVAARGGRCFAVKHGGAAADGELLVALPGVAGPRQVLVPRGLGRPLIGRVETNGWVVEGTGEVCSGRRWLAVGGLAARVRTTRLPRGPAVAVAPLRRSGPAVGAWLAVRIVNPGLTAAAAADGSLRQGPVALIGARVREVSAEARAAGVVPGMSPRLALRKCPSLRCVGLPARDLVAEVRAALEAEVGEPEARRGGFVLRLPAASVGELFALADQLILRLWQEAGVHVRLAIAAEPGAALRLTRLLEPDSVGLIPATAAGAWRRRGSPRRAGAWVGPSLVDIEGIVAKARALVEQVSGPGALRVVAAGRSVDVRCAAGVNVAQVENALRAHALQLGEVRTMSWHGAEGGRQLPLLAGARA